MSTDNTRTNESRRWTLSSTCLIPMLGRTLDWYSVCLVNCYFGERNHPEYDENIFVLLNKRAHFDLFRLIEGMLKADNCYVTDYEIDINLQMFVFRVPEIFKDDYKLFRKGRYSKMSPLIKRLILGNEKVGTNYDILMKTKERREFLEEELDVSIDDEAELFDPPNPEVEIYSSEKAEIS